jgi:hypothetical protein
LIRAESINMRSIIEMTHFRAIRHVPTSSYASVV